MTFLHGPFQSFRFGWTHRPNPHSCLGRAASTPSSSSPLTVVFRQALPPPVSLVLSHPLPIHYTVPPSQPDSSMLLSWTWVRPAKPALLWQPGVGEIDESSSIDEGCPASNGQLRMGLATELCSLPTGRQWGASSLYPRIWQEMVPGGHRQLGKELWTEEHSRNIHLVRELQSLDQEGDWDRGKAL